MPQGLKKGYHYGIHTLFSRRNSTFAQLRLEQVELPFIADYKEFNSFYSRISSQKQQRFLKDSFKDKNRVVAAGGFEPSDLGVSQEFHLYEPRGIT